MTYDYSIEDKYQKECSKKYGHPVWIKICVHCGYVIENSEYATIITTGTCPENKVQYIQVGI